MFSLKPEMKIDEEILVKLKLEEEKEKKKMEKEAKRREELEKMKKESFLRQADTLIPLKKENKKVQQKKYPNYQHNSNPKISSNNKKQTTNEGRYRRDSSSSEHKSNPKISSYNKKQSTNEGRYRRDSSSSENSGKRYVENCWNNSNRASASHSIWDDKNEHFPALGAEAPVPVGNVWEERKYKQQEIQSLQPQSKYDEEAMLQQALALSLMEATREEEQKQKLEDEYKLQMELLEQNPEILDNFKELDVFTVPKKSEFESFNSFESSEEKPHSENFTRNAALSSIIQKSKTSSSGGAKPKINKIIDNFGGWGLKDNYKEKSNSQSNFANDIDAWKQDNCLPGFQQQSLTSNYPKPENVNNSKTSKAEIKKHVVSDSWSDDFDREKTSKKAGKHDNHLPGFEQKSIISNPPQTEMANNWETSDTEIKNHVVSDSWSDDLDSEKTSKKDWKHDNHLPGFEQKSIINNPPKTEIVNNWETSDTEITKHVVSDSWSDDFDSEKISKVWKCDNHLPGFEQKSMTSNPPKPEKVNNWETSDTTTNKNHVVSHSWSDDIKKNPASDLWDNEVLSDEKEVPFDDNEVSLSHLNSVAVGFDTFSKEKEYYKDKRSNDISGKGHSSAVECTKAPNQWEDVFHGDKATSNVTKNINSGGYFGSLSTNDAQTNWNNTESSFSNFETSKLVKKDTPGKNSSSEHDSLNVFTKSSMSKHTLDDSYNVKKEKELSNGNSFSQFENLYDVLDDNCKSKNGYAPTETFLNSDNIWSNKSPNNSTASHSAFPNLNISQTELSGKEAPFKFDTVEEGVLETIDKEIDTPSILPPHPVPAVPEVKELDRAINAEMSSNEYTKELPPILPPQASPQVPSPYLLNPAMFPVVNPMLGLGMDPITMRQMLMLSNPFFASQLLAMEQYYRTMGIPVDLFSFPTQPVPNMLFPGLANISEQYTFPNPVDMNMSSPQFVQNHYQDQSAVISKNKDGVSSEEHLTKYPSDLNKNVKVNVPDTDENLWYASLLSNDNESVIPPPKPLNVDGQISSTSLLPDTTGSNSMNTINSKDYLCTNASSNIPKGESHKSITTVGASMPKTEACGWGDLDNDSFHNSKPKTSSCKDDYGWETENFPTKSVKSPSKYEDKKAVHRQPARQPQLSRFQRNRRFN